MVAIWEWAGIAVLVLVGIAVFAYLIERRGVFQDDSEEPDGGSDRISRVADTSVDDRRLSVRDKPKQLPIEAKIALGAAIAILCLLSYMTVQFYQTGSAAEFAYTTQLKEVFLVVAGVAGGLVLKSHQREKYGTLTVEYETEDGDEIEDVETIHYDATSVEVVDGDHVVREVFPRWYFGLFRRYKLAAHDRRLRKDRPLGQFVRRKIPPHAIQTGSNEHRIRTQGDIINPGGDGSPADIEYRAPVTVPYSHYLEQREENSKMRMRLGAVKAELAEADTHIQRLMRALQNEDHTTRQQVMDEMKQLREILGAQHQQIHLEGGQQPAARPAAGSTRNGRSASGARQAQQKRAGPDGGDGS